MPEAMDCKRVFLAVPAAIAEGSRAPSPSRHGPPNSSQQPTTCRSLARRFRASFCATLRVALPESEGTWRLSERTLGGTKLECIDTSAQSRPLLANPTCRRSSYSAYNPHLLGR